MKTLPTPADNLDGVPPQGLEHPAFREVFRFWLKLGFISFGGPTGQIAVMHAELVEKKKWISEARFLHALNYCMLLPGPEAQQLASRLTLFPGSMFEAHAGAFGSIGPASPVLGQRTRIVQTDPFGLVDQPLQLGPLSFGNRTLIILIKQVGYSRLRYRVQLQKTQLGFFQRKQFA
jgi:hypothetical protein